MGQLLNRGCLLTARKKILIVSSEQVHRQALCDALQALNHTCLTATDGRNVSSIVESEKPDLVLLDIMMPYMDGLEVLQRLRKNVATRELPVILMSPFAQDADVFAAWKSEVDFLLSVPIDTAKLNALIQRLCGHE